MHHLWQISERWLSKLNEGQIVFLALLLVAILGWLDYITGFEVSFSFFYLLPISIAAWYLGIRGAFAITALSILTWLVSNWLAGEIYSNEWIRLFNAGVRLVVFIAIANLLHELKRALQFERTIARTDYLTGIFNRREFIEQLAMEVKRAERMKYPTSLAYIDLDNFKKLNDEFGHSAGDEHLKRIAHAITNVIRKTDLFARLGGDEFGLFLPNVGQRNAKSIFEKISKAVTQELDSLHSPVTLSIGVVTFKTPPASVDDMIHKADSLMYQAKQTGKKQIIYFEVE